MSLRPESVAVVGKEVRNYWVYETAKRTLERIRRMQDHENRDTALSWEVYNPDLEQYKYAAKKALMAIKEEFEAITSEKEETEEAEDKREEIRDGEDLEEEF